MEAVTTAHLPQLVITEAMGTEAKVRVLVYVGRPIIELTAAIPCLKDGRISWQELQYSSPLVSADAMRLVQE